MARRPDRGPTPRPHVRAAGPRDVEVLVRHRHGMWEDIDGNTSYSARALAEADRVYRAWLLPRLRRHEVVGFIAEHPRGSPVGSGCVWLRELQPRPLWPSGKLPYVMSMYTEPSARGKGAASSIIRSMLRWARKERYPRVSLHASEMGRGVYANLGFERTWEMRYDLRSAHPAPRKARSERSVRGARR